jgi:histidine ammonia-lyase
MAGAQPAVADTYRAFLDRDVTPVVPSRGSVGEADITLASHIGLAMVGEWFAEYQGRRLPAKEALALAGITPLAPVGKDFLAIVSTNALTAGQATLLARDARAYLDRAIVVFALSLEGFNGNVAPFLAETTEIRPFPGMVEAAARIRAALEGSYLWQPVEGRALQDPLSFRTAAYALGNALEASAELDAALAVQINHTDDNPAAVAGPWHPAEADGGQVERYRVDGAVDGALYPTANFEMLPVAVRLEHLTGALARLSQNIVMQTIRFENPELTKLPRFLAAPTNEGHAFGAMQKPLVALYAENRQLAMPVSLDTFAMAGTIEDTASNAPLAVANLDRVLDNMYQLSSIQLLHAAQAVDLRRRNALGRSTRALLAAYRVRVPFATEDRVYTGDFAAGMEVLRGFAAVTP